MLGFVSAGDNTNISNMTNEGIFSVKICNVVLSRLSFILIDKENNNEKS